MKKSFIIKISILIFSYGLFLNFTNQTILPLEVNYTRNYLPWKAQDSTWAKHQNWNSSYKRDGDARFEFMFTSIQHLKNPKAINNNITLGYPYGSGFGTCRGLTIPLARIFLKIYPKEFIKSFCLAYNLVACFWFVFAFLLLYAIGIFIVGKSVNPWAFFGTILIAHPAVCLSMQEPWMMAYSGILAIALGIILFIYNNNFNLYIKYFIVLLGSFLVFGSNIFQFYLYVPLLYLISFPLIIKHLGIKKYIFIGFFIGLGLFVNFQKVFSVLEFLAISNKQNDFISLIEMRKYCYVFFNNLIDTPKFLTNLIPQKLHLPQSFSAVLTNTFPFIGLFVFLFGLIALIKIKSKSLWLFAGFIALYWAGPVHLLLEFLIGKPFQTETSLRMGLFLLPLLAFLSLKSFHEKKYLEYFKKIKILAIVFLAINLCFLALTWVFVKEIHMVSIVHGLAILGILFLFKKNSRLKQLSFFLIWFIVPLSNLFAFTLPESLKPNSIDLSKNKLVEVFEMENSRHLPIVGALLRSKSNHFSEQIHPNFWYDFPKAKSIHAYRNPILLDYAELFWFQNLIADKKLKNPLDSLETKKKLKTKLRNNWLIPIPFQDSLSFASKRIFDLCNVNFIAMDARDKFENKNWKKVSEHFGISIYEKTFALQPFQIINEFVVEKNPYKRMYHLLCDSSFNLQKTVLLDKKIKEVNPKSINKILSWEEKNGTFQIEIQGNGNCILKTNLLYYNSRKAKMNKNKLKIIKINHTFLGIIIPKNKIQKNKIIIN